MKIIGLIAEYNPFHLGHLYQINKIKELYPDSIIILIVSSNFTQRGDISIINKWNKTKIALDNKIDLVIEFPYVYATQSADIFAKGAIEILNHLKIDALVFGTESNNLEDLIKCAKTQLTDNSYQQRVKEYLSLGYNYPTSMSKALENISNININTPNDLLGLSYIKEIISNNYKIEPIAIKRTNNYHDREINNNIINASLIRDLYKTNKDIKDYIPKYKINNLYKNSINDFYPYLVYNIYNNINNLNKFQTVDEGIENRIINALNKSNSWEELVQNIKTKRYTYNKINRMLIHILTNFTKEEANDIEIDYIRLLGFSKQGRIYLNNIKKDINIPIITNYKKKISKLLDIENRINRIYSIVIDKQLIELEYKHKPIIK